MDFNIACAAFAPGCGGGGRISHYYGIRRG